MGKKKKSKGLKTSHVYPVVLALTLLVHLPSFWNPYQFDDFHHVAENQSVMSLKNLGRFFVEPGLFTNKAIEGMYRPLLMSTHALTYAVFGADPRGGHLVNLILHLANAALVMSLLRRWTKSDYMAALGGLFWALAAIQHESVGYICARSTLLASMFMLIAIRVTDESDQRGFRSGAIAFSCCVLALLAKEIAFVTPLLILLRDVTLGRVRFRKVRERWLEYAALLSLMPLYFLARSLMFSATLGPLYTSRISYLLTQARVFFWYLGKTLFPINLTIFPGQPIAADLLSPSTIVPAMGVAALMVLGVLVLDKAPRVSFGIFWFMICMAPTSTLVPLFRVSSIERVYLPLLGLVVIGIEVRERVFPGKGSKVLAAAIALAMIIFFNGLITVHRHRVWNSGVGLWKDTLKKAPKNHTPWIWLGIMEGMEGDKESVKSAKKYILKALLLKPDDEAAREALGEIYILMGDNDSARQEMERFLADPATANADKVIALLKLARIDMDEGDIQKAKVRARKVLEIQPENAEAYFVLGKAAFKEEHVALAKQHLHRALELYPDYPGAEVQLGVIALNEKDLITARRYFMGVVRRNKAEAVVYSNLGFVSHSEGKLEEARQWYERAIEEDPEDSAAYFGIGLYYTNTGDFLSALKHLNIALEKNPDFTAARDRLARVYMNLIKKGGLDVSTRRSYLTGAAEHIRWLKGKGLGADLEKEWMKITGRSLD